MRFRRMVLSSISMGCLGQHLGKGHCTISLCNAFLLSSGGLRAASSNTTILHAAELLVPAEVVLEHYNDLGGLPDFNSDLEERPPAELVELRERVGIADGLVMCCPEYARGLPDH